MQPAVSLSEVTFEVIGDSLADEQRWLELRMLGIGASEIACVVGISPWTSPYALWAQKTKRVPPVDLSSNEPVFWGKHFEWPIITGFGHRTGRAVVPFALLIRSLRWPWLLATPDALTTDDPDARARAPQLTRLIGTMRRLLRQKRAVPFDLVSEFERLSEGWWPLQVKNIGFNSADHWHEGAPDYYQVQCQQEALLLGKTRCTAAACVAGQTLIWQDVQREELSDRRIVNLSKTFWNEHVLKDVAPEVDASNATTEALKARWPRTDPERLVQLPATLQQDAEERDVLKAQIKELEERIALIDNKVREALQDAPEGRFPDGSGFTYKQHDQPARTVTYEARSSRTLLRKAKPSEKKPRARKKSAAPLMEET